jgi:hypothetical protein
MTTQKDMTENGPRQLLGDYLEACIHRSFTNDADGMLQSGFLNRDQRIALSAAIGRGLDAFHAALPAELAGMDMNPTTAQAHMVESYSLSKLISKVEGIMSSVTTWFKGKDTVEQKVTYDTSSWDGSAGQWETAEAYCSDCLIDTNSGSGPKVKDKCHLPYRKPGSALINKNALRAIGAGAHSITAVKADSADKTKAANWVISHWKSAFGTPAPDAVYKIAGKAVPSAGEKSSIQLLKATDGEMYILLTYSNKWEDREDDIISEKAHENYAKFVNEQGFRPQITPFHQPTLPERTWLKIYHAFRNDIPRLNDIVRKVFRDTGSSIAEVDRVVYMHGFSTMIGKVYPDMQEVAEKLAGMPDIGSSHAFVVTDFSRREKSGKIVNEYWSFEGSPLPRHRAANPLTALAIEEKSMPEETVEAKLNPSDEKWLKELFGEERFGKIKNNFKELEPTLNQLLAHKAVMSPDEGEDAAGDEMEPTGKKKKPVAAAKKEVEPEATPAADTAAVVAEVLKALNVEELQGVLKNLFEGQKALTTEIEGLKTLREQVTQIKKSDDQRVAEAITPFSWAPGFLNSKSPAQSEETKVGDQEATKSKVETDAPKAPAVSAKNSENPLDMGLWSMFS